MKIQTYITTAENSPPGTLLNHPTAIVRGRYELLGQFLTIELDSTQRTLFRKLPRIITAIVNGKQASFSGGDGFHDITISKDVVRIENPFLDPPAICDVPMEAFVPALIRWLSFVKEYEHKSKKPRKISEPGEKRKPRKGKKQK